MDKVLKLLRPAGWEEGRKVSIAGIKTAYFNPACEWNEIQESFLAEYANLEIKYMHPLWQQEVILSVNPLQAQNSVTCEIIDKYERFLNEGLLVVGEIERENMTLLMSKTGNFYGVYDDCIIRWGVDFKIMVYNLIHGIKGDLVVMDDC